MTLDNLLFVGAFIVLPLIIAIWSITTLRALRRRRAIALMPDSLDTDEMEGIELPPHRDWAASVQALRTGPRAPAADDAGMPLARARPFYPPAYRGRSLGVVKRATPPAAQWSGAHRPRRLRRPRR